MRRLAAGSRPRAARGRLARMSDAAPGPDPTPPAKTEQPAQTMTLLARAAGAAAGSVLGAAVSAGLTTSLGAWLTAMVVFGLLGGLVAGLATSAPAGAPALDAPGGLSDVRARRTSRLALGAAGSALLLGFAGPADRSRWSSGASMSLPDDVQAFLGFLAPVAAMVVALVMHLLAVRRGDAVGQSRWLHPGALVLGALVAGLGLGQAAGWCTAWAGNEGIFALVIGAPILGLWLAVGERGPLPTLALVLALAAATGMAGARVWIDGARPYRVDDTLGIALGTSIIVLLGHLLVRALVHAFHPAPSPPSPLGWEVRARDGAYLLVVEAPGLAAGDPVRVDLDAAGQRARVRLGRRVVDPDEVLASTRVAGPCEVEVALPSPVQPDVVSREVKDGLLTVMLTPRGPA